MRIVIDTNIVLDVLLKREPFFQQSYNIMKQAVEDGHIQFVSVTAITDIYYLLRRSLKDSLHWCLPSHLTQL